MALLGSASASVAQQKPQHFLFEDWSRFYIMTIKLRSPVSPVGWQWKGRTIAKCTDRRFRDLCICESCLLYVVSVAGIGFGISDEVWWFGRENLMFVCLFRVDVCTSQKLLVYAVDVGSIGFGFGLDDEVCWLFGKILYFQCMFIFRIDVIRICAKVAFYVVDV